MFDHLFLNSSKLVNFFVIVLVKLELTVEHLEIQDLNDECLICGSLSNLLQFLNPRVSIGLTLPEPGLGTIASHSEFAFIGFLFLWKPMRVAFGISIFKKVVCFRDSKKFGNVSCLRPNASKVIRERPKAKLNLI